MSAWFPIVWMFAGCADRSGAPEHDEPEHGEREHAGGHRAVELSPEAVAAARIEVREAAAGSLTSELSMPARIALDPRKEALVSAWISGQVDAIDVRTGDVVKKYQRLARVQSPELGEAVDAYRAAKALDDAADAKLARLGPLVAEGVSSKAQLLQAEAEHTAAASALEAAEERLRILGVDPSVGDPHSGEHYPSRVPVRSPIAGQVLTASATVGERVQPGQALFYVGDLDEVWLMLDVYERDLSSVRAEQTVRFVVEAWPGETFEGVVAQVGGLVDPESRTTEVRVVVANPEHRLKPNMFAQAQLTVDRPLASCAVVLPSDAVQRVEGGDVVFVQEEPGHYEPRPVVVAERTSAEVCLSSGVAAAEPVVVSGAFALKSELEKGELGHGHAH